MSQPHIFKVEVTASDIDVATNWTFVDVASGRPRGVPEHVRALIAAQVPCP